MYFRALWGLFESIYGNDVKNIRKKFFEKNHEKRSSLPTLFLKIFFSTNGSFGLPRACTFILGCAIAFSKKSRFTRGSPFVHIREKTTQIIKNLRKNTKASTKI